MVSDKMTDTDLIRNEALHKRNSLTEEQLLMLSSEIIKKLSYHDLFLKSANVGLYASYKSEVITYPLINRAIMLDKMVGFPKVMKNSSIPKMDFYYVSGVKDLKSGYKGIPEPSDDAYLIKNLDLIIVPVVAFDENCNRIGYGCGYYDRFLSEHTNVKTIGIAFECQKMTNIKPKSTDKKLDLIITEENIYGDYE